MSLGGNIKINKEEEKNTHKKQQQKKTVQFIHLESLGACVKDLIIMFE